MTNVNGLGWYGFFGLAGCFELAGCFVGSITNWLMVNLMIGNRPSIVIVEKVILACLMWDKIFDNTTERIAVLNRNIKDRRNTVSAKSSMAISIRRVSFL